MVSIRVRAAMMPAAVALWLALGAVWIAFLVRTVPAISRADFLWEMWHIAPAVEQGDIGDTLVWVFKIFGGHIVAYTRLLQLANYVWFDYSGEFVRWAGIGAYAAALVALLWLCIN